MTSLALEGFCYECGQELQGTLICNDCILDGRLGTEIGLKTNNTVEIEESESLIGAFWQDVTGHMWWEERIGEFEDLVFVRLPKNYFNISRYAIGDKSLDDHVSVYDPITNKKLNDVPCV